MAGVSAFEELEVWKKARVLTKNVYELTKKEMFFRDYTLREQIRRASVSIMSNIAEGYERDGNKEFVQFLSIAKGSVGEVRSQLFLAYDLGYLDQNKFKEFYDQTRVISKMLANFIIYLKKSWMKGHKFVKAEEVVELNI